MDLMCSVCLRPAYLLMQIWSCSISSINSDVVECTRGTTGRVFDFVLMMDLLNKSELWAGESI